MFPQKAVWWSRSLNYIGSPANSLQGTQPYLFSFDRKWLILGKKFHIVSTFTCIVMNYVHELQSEIFTCMKILIHTVCPDCTYNFFYFTRSYSKINVHLLMWEKYIQCTWLWVYLQSVMHLHVMNDYACGQVDFQLGCLDGQVEILEKYQMHRNIFFWCWMFAIWQI